MNTKHTPGPWTLDKRLCWAIVDAKGQDVTYQDLHGHPEHGSVASRGRSAPELEANARLIAAAPEMLAALEDLREWASLMGGWDAPSWERARAAIAKATGQD